MHGGALYAQSADGSLSDGTGEKGETFFGEYKRKLENIGERLFTARARELAARTAAPQRWPFTRACSQRCAPPAKRAARCLQKRL